MSKIGQLNIDVVTAMLENGLTQAQIAKSYGVEPSELSRWAYSESERSQLFARARENSAEAWLDRGLLAIESSMSKSGDVDPSAARAYAQECARRAGIYNAKYKDKQGTQVNVAVDNSQRLNLSGLSDSELNVMKQMLLKSKEHDKQLTLKNEN